MRLTASFLVGLALGGRVYFYFLPRVERSVLRLHFCQEGLWLSIRWRSTFRGSKYEGARDRLKRFVQCPAIRPENLRVIASSICPL